MESAPVPAGVREGAAEPAGGGVAVSVAPRVAPGAGLAVAPTPRERVAPGAAVVVARRVAVTVGAAEVGGPFVALGRAVGATAAQTWAKVRGGGAAPSLTEPAPQAQPSTSPALRRRAVGPTCS